MTNKGYVLVSGILLFLVLIVGAFYYFTSTTVVDDSNKITDVVKQNVETNSDINANVDNVSAEVIDDNINKNLPNQVIDNSNTDFMTNIEVPVTEGGYEIYSPEKIKLVNNGNKVVLFFRASWCPTCKTLDSNIKANLDNMPVNLTILDVDYDKYSDLKKKYGVTYQHTLVQVDADGNIITKWSGSSTLTDIISKLK